MIGTRTNELDAIFLADVCKHLILTKEPVSGMNGISICDFGRSHDVGDAQV